MHRPVSRWSERVRQLESRRRFGAGTRSGGPSFATAAAVGIVALAASALVNRQLARSAERRNPPRGRFLTVRGVRLHYVERGKGRPLVLLHGNGSMIQDFEASGLLDLAAAKYRVIVFDRPGFGYSARPRGTVWSPDAQADLFHEALAELDALPAIVLGQSWGAQVAAALGMRHPDGVAALVLASGYYYPTARLDLVPLSAPAVPIVGDLFRYTLAPLLGRLIWPALMRKIFGPAEVPAKFAAGFPTGLALRPSQLRASAAETALMVPDAFALEGRYRDLPMPVVVTAGALDRLVDTDRQSAELAREIGHSRFRPVAGAGHMVHQTAVDAVMAAIDEAADAAAAASRHQAAVPV
jgi:pimeloyl-ACP methyl ester carboxylesterase